MKCVGRIAILFHASDGVQARISGEEFDVDPIVKISSTSISATVLDAHQPHCTLPLPNASGDSLPRFADGIQGGPRFGFRVVGINDVVGTLRLIDPTDENEFVLDYAPRDSRTTRWHIRQPVPFGFLFAKTREER